MDNPAISGADGVGEIGGGLFWVSVAENLVDVSPLVGAILGDFPFVPDFDAAILEPADIIRGGLINPEHFEGRSLECDFFGSENGEFFG